MSRRRALRTLGAALAVAAVPSIGPGRAFGQARRLQTCKRCFVKIKFGTHEGGCCITTPGYEQECCVGPNLDKEHPNLMSWCCARGACGPSGGSCKLSCPSGQFLCGSKRCCQKVRPTLPAEGLLPGPLPACVPEQDDEVRYQLLHEEAGVTGTGSAARSAAATARAAIRRRPTAAASRAIRRARAAAARRIRSRAAASARQTSRCACAARNRTSARGSCPRRKAV